MELKRLKRKAKRLYRKIREEEDKYSCGKKLAEYISPNIGPLKAKFNDVWDRVRVLDPDAPRSPFPREEPKAIEARSSEFK